jgi:hypothetical protein
MIWPVSTTLVNDIERAGLAVESLRLALAKLPTAYRWLPLSATLPELADIYEMVGEAQRYFEQHGPEA